ncbi:MazG-like family protein [Labrenzia sp. R4_1]|uniref:MazG-like family protein n=1 Tax=Labrenzia sp. R4_1 TaxID=2821106 RepID=UPI001ADA4B7E|nr:MazG-like family protein [Labrenzia sp. R4_1]MBO9426107.1 MazG-like family protein [Labrenzia sp. R4_1]
MFQIFELTQADPKSLLQRTLKLSEETGELAEAVLSVTDAPGSAYKAHTLQNVREEAADAALVALSVLAQTCETSEEFSTELDRLMREKSAKWQAKLTE